MSQLPFFPLLLSTTYFWSSGCRFVSPFTIFRLLFLQWQQPQFSSTVQHLNYMAPALFCWVLFGFYFSASRDHYDRDHHRARTETPPTFGPSLVFWSLLFCFLLSFYHLTALMLDREMRLPDS